MPFTPRLSPLRPIASSLEQHHRLFIEMAVANNHLKVIGGK